MEPERVALGSLLTGTGLEAPERPRPSLGKMQQTTVGISSAAADSLKQAGSSLVNLSTLTTKFLQSLHLAKLGFYR